MLGWRRVRREQACADAWWPSGADCCQATLTLHRWRGAVLQLLHQLLEAGAANHAAGALAQPASHSEASSALFAVRASARLDEAGNTNQLDCASQGLAG